MSDENEKSTLQLLLEFNAVAIAIPLFVLAMVYGYSKIYGLYLTRRIWKTVFFIAWIGTLLVFFREFIKSLLTYYLRKSKSAHSSHQLRPDRLDAWEQRKSIRIGKDVALAAIIVPVIALLLVYVADQFLDFSSKDWRLAIMVIWIGTIASLIKVVLYKH